jgi:hypothetical protein
LLTFSFSSRPKKVLSNLRSWTLDFFYLLSNLYSQTSIGRVHIVN